MSYARSASVQKLIDNAHTKLIVWFLDGNVRLQYGRNHLREGRVAADPRAVELKRHHRSVAKNASFIRVAIIYDLATGEEVSRFKRGEWL
ncbi:MAG: hypothetical protein ACRYFX_05680 [Janthinobacterium lividum]